MSFLLEQGGWMMVFILLLALGATALFFDRLLRLRKIAIDYQDFIQGVFTVFDKGNTEEAIAICEESPGPIAAIVGEALVHRASNRENLIEIINATAHSELSRLERRAAQIGLFAQLFPLFGLIGTLTAAYQALGEIAARAPLIDAALVALPLSRALSSTIAGLAAAAACHAMHHALKLRIDNLMLDMESTAVLTLDHLSRSEDSNGE